MNTHVWIRKHCKLRTHGHTYVHAHTSQICMWQACAHHCWPFFLTHGCPMAFSCLHLAFMNSSSSVFTVFSILSWLAVHHLYLFFNLWSLSCHQFMLFFHCREPSIMTWLVVRSGKTRGNMSAPKVDESILCTAKSSERKRTGNSHRPCWAVGLGEGNSCDRTREQSRNRVQPAPCVRPAANRSTATPSPNSAGSRKSSSEVTLFLSCFI